MSRRQQIARAYRGGSASRRTPAAATSATASARPASAPSPAPTPPTPAIPRFGHILGPLPLPPPSSSSRSDWDLFNSVWATRGIAPAIVRLENGTTIAAPVKRRFVPTLPTVFEEPGGGGRPIAAGATFALHAGDRAPSAASPCWPGWAASLVDAGLVEARPAAAADVVWATGAVTLSVFRALRPRQRINQFPRFGQYVHRRDLLFPELQRLQRRGHFPYLPDLHFPGITPLGPAAAMTSTATATTVTTAWTAYPVSRAGLRRRAFPVKSLRALSSSMDGLVMRDIPEASPPLHVFACVTCLHPIRIWVHRPDDDAGGGDGDGRARRLSPAQWDDAADIANRIVLFALRSVGDLCSKTVRSRTQCFELLRLSIQIDRAGHIWLHDVRCPVGSAPPDVLYDLVRLVGLVDDAPGGGEPSGAAPPAAADPSTTKIGMRAILRREMDLEHGRRGRFARAFPLKDPSPFAAFILLDPLSIDSCQLV